MKRLTASVQIQSSRTISAIDNRIYSSFIEHMGRAVYTGVYEPDHPSADANGFRTDVMEYIRPLNLPYIRYPGGNFLSGYRWQDGIGDKSSRPVRPDLAWSALEPNQVGTDDFIDFCRSVGTRPLMAVNLGTKAPQDAVDLLEYCNFPQGTYYSDLRRRNGHESPYDIKLWCLGNEMDGPWQICGKTAEEYGRVACETAKMMKWLDPSIELVACGSSFKTMPTYGAWERTVLKHCYEHIDYLSLHQYYQNNDGDLPCFLAHNVEMDAFIKEVAGICREAKAKQNSEKDIYLSFDEWNVWYHFQKDCPEPQKWIVGRPIEEEVYDLADALLVGSMLITLINNADVVKIACLAQLVNTIAPIMTEPGGRAWVQTIYYPFLYTSQHGRGTALSTVVTAPAYTCSVGDNIPFVDVAAVLSDSAQELVLFLVNKHQTDEISCAVSLDGFAPDSVLEAVSLTGATPSECNTADSSPVLPAHHSHAKLDARGLDVPLSPLSWNMVRIALR